jgi:hypothetical protein
VRSGRLALAALLAAAVLGLPAVTARCLARWTSWQTGLGVEVGRVLPSWRARGFELRHVRIAPIPGGAAIVTIDAVRVAAWNAGGSGIRLVRPTLRLTGDRLHVERPFALAYREVRVEGGRIVLDDPGGGEVLPLPTLALSRLALVVGRDAVGLAADGVVTRGRGALRAHLGLAASGARAALAARDLRLSRITWLASDGRVDADRLTGRIRWDAPATDGGAVRLDGALRHARVTAADGSARA